MSDEKGHPLNDEEDSGNRQCTHWAGISEARITDERHRSHETILNFVQQAPEEKQWMVNKEEFDEMPSTMTDSAPGPDRFAGGIRSELLFNAFKYVAEGGDVPPFFVTSTTVFIPKADTVDDNGRIVRSPGALRLLTLWNCDCEILTTAMCNGLHQYFHKVHPSSSAVSPQGR